MEVLQKRDKEMSDFMDKFEQTKGEALADQRAARATIVGLLEHISTGLESQHNVPDKGRMRVRVRQGTQEGRKGGDRRSL